MKDYVSSKELKGTIYKKAVEYLKAARLYGNTKGSQKYMDAYLEDMFSQIPYKSSYDEAEDILLDGIYSLEDDEDTFDNNCLLMAG